MVQVLDLLASNLEQPVSIANKTFGQPQHSTDHHLRHVIWINILGGYQYSSAGFDGWETIFDVDSSGAGVCGVEGASRGVDSTSTRIGLS